MIRRAAAEDARAARLGAQLRAAREVRGWSRPEMVARLPCAITFQTLASYESGYRHFTVTRLLDLCEVLDVSAVDLIEKITGRRGEVVVSRRALAGSTWPSLTPLRRWASASLTRDPGRDRIVLSATAVAIAAELCGLSAATMDAHLRSTTSVEEEEVSQ
ncbi:helix-turn-helix domain-containing protein [Actinokineospora sp. HUAS TT18]|uniref:helix-turn-helix domain-containing protein n=1 Tax=Actinokineospora sp. HUAS TT18 TaxID=3447451 RepID=UPI003F527832